MCASLDLTPTDTYVEGNRPDVNLPPITTFVFGLVIQHYFHPFNNQSLKIFSLLVAIHQGKAV